MEKGEAHLKHLYITRRLWQEQHKVNFLIQDLRPEQILKKELIAYWEGRIKELHGWSDIIDEVKNAILDPIKNALTSLWNNVISPGVSSIVSGFKWIWDAAKNAASKAKEWASEAYNKAVDVWNTIQNVVKQKLDDVWNSLKNIGTLIWNKVVSAVKSLSSFFSHIGHLVWDAIKGFFSSAFSAISSAFKTAHNFISNSISGLHNFLKGVWDQLTTKISGAFETITRGISALPQVLANAWKSALGFLVDIFKTIWNKIFVPLGNTLLSGLKTAISWIQNIFKSIVMWPVNFFLSHSRATPEGTFAKLPIFLAGVLGAAGIGMGVAVAADIVHPFKDIGAKKVFEWLFHLSKMDVLIAAAGGALALTALKTPLTYYFNNLFRPNRPSVHEVIELKSRYKISDQEFFRELGYAGLSEDFYDWYKELAISPIRYFAAAAVAKTGYYDEELFDEELKRSGYSKKAIAVMKQMYKATANDELKGHYASYAIKRFKEGYVSQDEFENEMKMLGYPETQRKKLVWAAKFARDTERMDTLVKAAIYDYEHGKIDLDGLKAKLASLGIGSDRVSELIQLSLAKAKVDVHSTQTEEVRAYGKGIAIVRYKEGMTTQDEMVHELKMLGYTDEQIARYKIYADLERDYAFAKEVMSTLRSALRKDKIGEETFISTCRSMGFTDQRIQLEISLARIYRMSGVSSAPAAS